MRFVIGAVALLVLGSIFGSLAGMLFWPDLSYATISDLSYATISVRGMRLERHNMFLHTNRHHGLRLPDRPSRS
jgi:hypothetical protein